MIDNARVQAIDGGSGGADFLLRTVIRLQKHDAVLQQRFPRRSECLARGAASGTRLASTAGIHGRQLILVTQQDELGGRPDRLEKLGHHNEADHRHLIDDHHVGRYRILAMAGKGVAMGPIAEEGVQRGRGQIVLSGNRRESLSR